MFRRGILKQLDATIAENSQVIGRAIAVMEDQRVFMRELLLRSEKRMQQFDRRAEERHLEILAQSKAVREHVDEQGMEQRRVLLAILDRIERLEPGGGAAPA